MHWVTAFGRFQRDVSGNPIRMVGVVSDITERKQTEAEIIRLRRKAEGRGQRAEGINYVFDSAFWLEPTGYKTPPSTRWIQSVGV
ncbi:MAG: hypothetical protein KME31_28640 [Tolypothrix carrinoi HA7290-LM1]|nr:hypothetical protein [Tolypothrix carrinoi HA7290-LM1]